MKGHCVHPGCRNQQWKLRRCWTHFFALSPEEEAVVRAEIEADRMARADATRERQRERARRVQRVRQQVWKAEGFVGTCECEEPATLEPLPPFPGAYQCTRCFKPPAWSLTCSST